ncbi:ParB/RepB/Spo0J family partition protein [Fuchsiella alkaliacetigena]|uniref:ParB/RepB/Spo0J family partition protein n=1 Tax=Fuchsiella alkaliacetigena TaxID=957042 RepID=UPI002009EF58|nr:ParB/RepB/Spo0J family partition protein [Fuchsiella alkaliacetigena]MCK8824698.1 ParB N-terminal domain-containing protein [Fuchsiella alkaliacetigena]
MINEIIQAPVESLKPHPQNDEFFDDIDGENYQRFKESVQEDGIISPIVVSLDMTIISGHQRYRAAKDLGIEEVPVLIQDELTDEDQKLKALLAANFGRIDHNPIKQSKVISKYEELCGISHGGDRKSSGHNVRLNQKDIADQLGVDERTVRRIKKLQDLIPDLQDLVESGQLSKTAAIKVWSRLPEDEQQEFLEEIGKDKLQEMTTKDQQSKVEDLKMKLEKAEKEKLELERQKRVAESRKQKAEKEKAKLEKELEHEKSKEPEVVEKEVLPEHARQKLKELQIKAAKLDELKESQEEVKNYKQRKRELEKEIGQLLEYQRQLKEENDESAQRAKIVEGVCGPIRKLEKHKAEIEQLLKLEVELDKWARENLRMKADFLTELAELIYGRIDGVSVSSPQKAEVIEIEG